ncbi:hypothetical protein KTAU_06550 [Thermogemmatispora aurantia]|uniref:Uncharacterized protein n=1 Tax=Thermogemmatispora aurantia TaxID=2045279 RepID=A0A5J4K5M7_9CHLR|nr:hypothetical protein KTAU_06550 [Thermogemmatispora aurantia]
MEWGGLPCLGAESRRRVVTEKKSAMQPRRWGECCFAGTLEKGQIMGGRERAHSPLPCRNVKGHAGGRFVVASCGGKPEKLTK